MKYFVGVLVLLVSFSSWAQSSPISLEGTFSFSNLEVLKVKHYEMVRSSAIDRLKTLRESGFICEFVASQGYRCSKFDSAKQVPADLKQEILNNVAGYSLTFQPAVGAPHLENDGETLQEWTVPQTVIAGTDTFKTYRYQIVQGLHKITPLVNNELQNLTWVVASAEQISEPHSYEVRESSSTWTLYFLSLTFRK